MKKWALYIGATLLFFVFWMLWVFPYDALKSRIITEIENRSQGRYKLDVATMNIGIFGSVTFRDLKVSERIQGKEEPMMSTPRLKIGFSPFDLLSNKTDFSFNVQGSKGDLKGNFRQDADETQINLNFSDFPLTDLKFFTSKSGRGFRGALQGTVDLKMNKSDASKNDGKIDLEFENLVMEAGTLVLDPSSPDGTIDVPEMKLSGPKGSGIKADMKKEGLVFNSISFSGGDLTLDMDGKVVMVGANPRDYKVALQGGFKVVETVAKAIPILGFLESQKNSEGFYPLSLSGKLGNLTVKSGKFPIRAGS